MSTTNLDATTDPANTVQMLFAFKVMTTNLQTTFHKCKKCPVEIGKQARMFVMDKVLDDENEISEG
jgi:hypothetical protein